MPKRFSRRLRRQVEILVLRGEESGAIAASLDVSQSYVRKVRKELRDHPTIAPRAKSRRGPPRRFTGADDGIVREIVRKDSGAKLYALCETFRVRTGRRIHESTMSRLLRRLGFVRRKEDGALVERSSYLPRRRQLPVRSS